MSQQWFTLTKSLALAIDLINNIEIGKLTKLCKRVIETIHLKSENAFTPEEEEKLQLAFDLSFKEVESLLEIISFIWEQAAYHIAKPAILAQQLNTIGIHEDKVKGFTNLWKDMGPIVIEHFRKRSLAPKQLDTIKWDLSVQVAQANKIKLKSPNAVVEFGLDCPDKKNTEKIQLEFNHKELYTFFNQKNNERMALMDLISLGADKQAVVFDIGSAFTKIGFAGEFSPRHIVRSEIKTIVNGDLVTIKLFKDKGNIDYNELRDFFHMVYFRYLLVNPKERRVVICDSILKSVCVRNLIAQILFRDFEVVSICFVPSHLLALFSLGLKTGLVIDCGYEETTVVPIFEEFPILSAMDYINLAGKTVHQHINQQIFENGIVESDGTEKSAKSILHSIDEIVLEDIKVQCCFVGGFSSNLVAAPAKYPLDGVHVLNVNGRLRAHSLDILFQGNNDDQSITTTVLDAILKCPIDCRKLLAENVVVVGGTSMSPGFLSRFYAELNHILSTEPYIKKLFFKRFAFHKAAVPENCCIWQGGAMFSALEILAEQSISREAFQINSNIPDWSSVLSLSKEDTSKLLNEKYKWEGFRKTLPPSNQKISPISYSTELMKKDFGITK